MTQSYDCNIDFLAKSSKKYMHCFKGLMFNVNLTKKKIRTPKSKWHFSFLFSLCYVTHFIIKYTYVYRYTCKSLTAIFNCDVVRYCMIAIICS